MTQIWTLKANPNTPDDWRAIFRDWQKHAIDVVYAHPDGAKSAGVWRSVNTLIHPVTISRASIINFLNDLVDAKLVGYEERSGKGGYHRIYKPIMLWTEFEDLVIWHFIEKLMLIFPEHTALKIRGEGLKVQA